MKQFLFTAFIISTIFFVGRIEAAADIPEVKVMEIPSTKIESQFTYYDTNIEGLSAHN